jgi:uncharacterized integral membrane protein (TIGR02327 family)
MQVYGFDAVIRIVSHFVFIYIAFTGLGALRIDQLFKSLHTTQIRLILMLVAIAIGYTASTFFLELIVLGRNLFQVGF